MKQFLATAFALAVCANIGTAAHAAPQQSDPFLDKRNMMTLEICKNPGNLQYDFLEAARVAHVALVKCFLEKHPALIDAKDDDGINALMWSTVKQDNEAAPITADRDALFDYLAARKPSLVKDSKDKHGSNILAYMAMNNYPSRIVKALEMGADLNAKDNYGVSPYGEAASFGNNDIVAIFDKFAKDRGITINRALIPNFAPKTAPDRMPDGTPAPPLMVPPDEDTAPAQPQPWEFRPEPDRPVIGL